MSTEDVCRKLAALFPEAGLDEMDASDFKDRAGELMRLVGEAKELVCTQERSVEVMDCSACGESHLITFQKLGRPLLDHDWWGLCPKTSEPVLMRMSLRNMPV